MTELLIIEKEGEKKKKIKSTLNYRSVNNRI